MRANITQRCNPNTNYLFNAVIVNKLIGFSVKWLPGQLWYAESIWNMLENLLDKKSKVIKKNTLGYILFEYKSVVNLHTKGTCALE